MGYYTELYRYLTGRYTEVFERQQGKIRNFGKINPGEFEAGINDFFNNINLLNNRITEGRLDDLEKLERMSINEYYCTLNTWLKKIKTDYELKTKQK
jgi:hypothetical protein